MAGSNILDTLVRPRTALASAPAWRVQLRLGVLCCMLGGMLCAAPAVRPMRLDRGCPEGRAGDLVHDPDRHQFGRPAMDAFQKRYGIRVNFVRADSIELAARMLNEAQAGRPQADVFDGTRRRPPSREPASPSSGCPIAPGSGQGILGFRGILGRHQPVRSYPRLQHRPGAQGRRAAQLRDLLDRKWRGKMAWATHATSSARSAHRRGAGGDGRSAGRPICASSPSGHHQLGVSARTVVDQSIAGEYPLVLQIFNHQPVISARRGAPIDWIPMNPAMAVLSVAGVTKAAPHPSAAKLLVDFFISDEGQKLFRDAIISRSPPDVPPRDPALRPDGKSFRGLFFSPEETDAAMPHWLDVYNEIFR